MYIYIESCRGPHTIKELFTTVIINKKYNNGLMYGP